MKIFNRNSPSAKVGAARAPRVTAVLATLLIAPAVLHALVPTSLAIVQVFLEVCQFCVSILRICVM
jgi:hypothetical protein